MKTTKPLLSLIIPVYNERKRLQNIPHILNFLRSNKYSFELIVVNDGSDAYTTKTLTRMAKKYHFLLLGYSQNKGKGYAIKQGFTKARGQYLFFMDIDLSTPIEMITPFLQELTKSPLVIATRKSTTSRITAHQNILRESMGKSFTLLSRLLTGVQVSDFTCGFKAFRAQQAKRIFDHAQIQRWSFDTEILFLAKKYNIRIKEVPVVWKNSKETKVVFPNDIFTSLTELIVIYLNEMRGKYGKTVMRKMH
ncbi:MAG: hypothetical protein RLZZ455_420 [Candidatus Parcubacteria bacterium]|jgi:glycosyltransferase involved in cell wall biosynthesis